ncbi:MAG: hypothetical protein NVV68_06775 [Dokdonella sp.]|nr:hypothetical protein [Dokdonella sp.]
MPSVAARILTRLQARLLAIRGQGAMVHDLQGRVYLRRPTYDVDAESLPAVFLVRRPSSGTTREQRPGASSTLSTTTVIFDAIGLVRADDDSGLQAEHLLADMQRALERPDDVWLRDCGKTSSRRNYSW